MAELTRRSLLGQATAAAIGGGGAVALAAQAASGGPTGQPTDGRAGATSGAGAASGAAAGVLDGPGASGLRIAFHGEHQAGIDTLPIQAHARFVALDLRPGIGVDGVRRLMRLLSDDAARLTEGAPPLAAEDPELPALPSRLTITFGFGPGLFDEIGRSAQCPEVIRNLPAFSTDELQNRWSGGDLLIQICSDDPVPLSYAMRRLIRDARQLARVRWTQVGFNPARGTEPAGTTPRNLMGQRDGTANPAEGSADLAETIWSNGPGWLAGGSMLVLRRIRMDVDVWDDLGRPGKEQAIARRLSDGAPVTGGGEHDRPDLTAVDNDGLPIVTDQAHVIRATARTPAERMLRRGFSYDDGPDAEGRPDAGLLFAAYQADAATAFVPVQKRLAQADVLNIWITHVGSAAFAVPPGCRAGEYIGHQLIG